MTYNTINDAVTMPGEAQGALLAGRYRVVRQLGQGGMGSVWLAEDTQLDNKQFAIKMLPSILVSNKRAYRQLKGEALVAMRLVHPNIVQIRAFEENNGNPFLVMDYIDGQTLDDLLAEKGELGEGETMALLGPIATALDYAHGKGVVHRDVKPGNVMIARDGTPYILDFGIAREIQETMTRVTGKLSSGTLLYMSPEQLRGQPPGPSQDVYSFAAMAYECIKGEPPFSRGQIEYQIVNERPAPLGDTDFCLSVMNGLSKDPESRPSACAELFGEPCGNITPTRIDSRVPKADQMSALAKFREEINARLADVQKRMEYIDGCKSADAPGFMDRVRHADEWWRVLSEVERRPASVSDAQAIMAYIAEAESAIQADEEWLRENVALMAKAQTVDSHLDLARRYYEKNIFDMCISEARIVLDLDASNNEAKQLVHKAKSLLKRFMNVRAEIGGREVQGAKFYFDSAEFMTPHLITLPDDAKMVDSFIVRFVESGKLFEGTVPSMSVDWRGSRDVDVSLHELKTGHVKELSLPGGEVMEMIYCAPGEFVMGDNNGDADERPSHEVKLEKGFWLGRYEVTQSQWQCVIGGNPSYFSGRNMPVETVSWYDCDVFIAQICDRVRRQLGCRVRLPTEAEWEYACRAGSTGDYAGKIDDLGWYAANSASRMHPVGQKKCNAWGFYDMHGNLWEWCHDWYGDYAAGSAIDPRGPEDGTMRVLRGGSWDYSARFCRSSKRGRLNPFFRNKSLGFRICCPIEA